MPLQAPFRLIGQAEALWPNMKVFHIGFTRIAENRDGEVEARSATGRAVVFDPEEFNLRLCLFYEKINAPFNPPPSPSINLGATVQEFVDGHSRESGGLTEQERRRIVFACNSTSAGYARSNGFVIVGGHPMCKGWGATGLDETIYRPLYGTFTVLGLECGKLGLHKVELVRNEIRSPSDLPSLAIAGPPLVEDGEIKTKIPHRETKNGPCRNDEVNFHHVYTSFTGFGVTKKGEVICVSMFERPRGTGAPQNLGIDALEIGELLLQLGATGGILGGGGADTQQFIRGDKPEFMFAPSRLRLLEEGTRPEPEEPRGNGAIVTLLAR